VTPEDSSTAESTINAWMQQLASPIPNPGGGAASAVMLGISAGLASMVAGYGAADDGDTTAVGAVAAIGERALTLQQAALGLADADAAASKGFSVAYRLPEGEQRERAIHEASIHAAESAADVGAVAAALLPDLLTLVQLGKPALVSDVGVAAATLATVLQASLINLGVDLASAEATAGDPAAVPAQHPALYTALAALQFELDAAHQVAADVQKFVAPK